MRKLSQIIVLSQDEVSAAEGREDRRALPAPADTNQGVEYEREQELT